MQLNCIISLLRTYCTCTVLVSILVPFQYRDATNLTVRKPLTEWMTVVLETLNACMKPTLNSTVLGPDTNLNEWEIYYAVKLQINLAAGL